MVVFRLAAVVLLRLLLNKSLAASRAFKGYLKQSTPPEKQDIHSHCSHIEIFFLVWWLALADALFYKLLLKKDKIKNSFSWAGYGYCDEASSSLLSPLKQQILRSLYYVSGGKVLYFTTLREETIKINLFFFEEGSLHN